MASNGRTLHDGEPESENAVELEVTHQAGPAAVGIAPASTSGRPPDEPLLPGLIPSRAGSLAGDEVERLWEIYKTIAATWGETGIDPTLHRSQWLEFLEARTLRDPSYLGEYRSAIRVLDDLTVQHGVRALTWLLLESGVKPGDLPTTLLAHAKRYVVDEFIRVWLAAGGFRAYGAENYNGFVSGSRFAVRSPYRKFERHPVAAPKATGGVAADMSRHYDTKENQHDGKLFLFRDRTMPGVKLADLMIQGKSREEVLRAVEGPANWSLQGFMEEFANPEIRVELGTGLNRLGLPQTRIQFARAEGFEEAAKVRLGWMSEVIGEMGLKLEEAKVTELRGDHAAATCRMATTPAEEGHHAAKTIREVVYEEMQHMALACNMLAAIGSTPRINDPQSIPTYPHPMPGGVRPDPVAQVPACGYRDDDVDSNISKQLHAFDQEYSRMLDDLQNAWGAAGQADLWRAVGRMFSLRDCARALMETIIPGTERTYGPCFRYVGKPTSAPTEVV